MLIAVTQKRFSYKWLETYDKYVISISLTFCTYQIGNLTSMLKLTYLHVANHNQITNNYFKKGSSDHSQQPLPRCVSLHWLRLYLIWHIRSIFYSKVWKMFPDSTTTSHEKVNSSLHLGCNSIKKRDGCGKKCRRCQARVTLTILHKDRRRHNKCSTII